MEILVITGPPYSGKGTQCGILKSQVGYEHISTGDRIRQEKEEQTSIGRLMSEYEEKGDLVPDYIMKDLLGQIIDENLDKEGIILDGYPRTIPQVDTLIDLVESKNLRIEKIINIEVPKEELLERAGKRAETSDRVDDKNVDTHLKRIQVFEASTRPAIEYMKTKLDVLTFDGMGSIEEVTQRIKSSLFPEETVQPVSTWEQNRLDLSPVQDAVQEIRAEVSKVIIGQGEMLDLLLAGLFVGGHILLEGVPGIAKTLIAKLLAQTISADFTRIQFTPDLMPSDVVGTTIYNLNTSSFSFNKGPIFSNLVLIDEINRAPAKTQAALFEVMAEKQVTVDGTTHLMEFPFFVLATQNPIEQEGTYKLPEAQLDRFLFKINIQYPDLEEEKLILRRFKNDFKQEQTKEVKAVMTAERIKQCQELVEKVHIKDELLDYIANIIHNTRNSGDLFLGASPRASLAIMQTAKAIAAMSGRDFVTPDDIQFVAYPVLNHRIILTPEREMEGYFTKDVIDDIIKRIEVPR